MPIREYMTLTLYSLALSLLTLKLGFAGSIFPVYRISNQPLRDSSFNRFANSTSVIRELVQPMVNDGITRIEKASQRRLPKALIIGVKKGGTRALIEFLRVHPNIVAPGPEPHFFDRHYHLGLDWYRDLMPASLEGQVTIEKTPSYFITRDVPARVYNMSRDTKLILVVRDPVTRAISDYAQTAAKKRPLRHFHQLAFINGSGPVDSSWGAIKIGLYARHLQRWLRHFPLRQLHLVSGERLISEPAREMARVQRFLGLPRLVTDKHFYFNQTKGFPCLKKPARGGQPHCLNESKGRAHPKLAPDVTRRVALFYRPFNQKFYQMTGQDFGWS